MTARRLPHRARLLQLQKKIYRLLRSDADRWLGPLPAPIRRYEREFRRDFRVTHGRLPSVGKSELIRAMRKADVSFIADFHTFPQASRAALRLLREAVRPGERWVLGVELLSSQYQAELDAFQEGRLPLPEFLRRVNYAADWGFPWSTVAPLLSWARAHGVRVLALNRPRELLDQRSLRGATVRRVTHARELEARDQWAAGLLTDLFAEGAGRLRVAVLYGELHVASAHLPAQTARISRAHLGRALSTVSIHQNEDELYWKLAQRHRELDAQIVPLRLPKEAPASHSAYCVLSSTPWTKLQSLVSWAEQSAEANDPEARGLEEGLENEEETAVDSLALMRTYGETLCALLRLPPVDFGSLNVATLEQADFLDHLSRGKARIFSALETSILRHHVRNNLRIYAPRIDTAYLGSSSHNIPAEMAALHIFRSLTRSKAFYAAEREDFFRIAIESAFGFFGSLLLNPRRKCDHAVDHQKRLRELARGAEEAYELEREARSLALQFLKARSRGSLQLDRLLLRRRLSPAVVLAAREVGYVFGKRMHSAFLSGQISATPIARLLTPRSGAAAQLFQPSFEVLFAELERELTGSVLAATKSETI